MNKIIIIMILMLAIVSAQATDFNYKLTTVKTLKEDQQYKCSFITDDRVRTFKDYDNGKHVNVEDYSIKNNLSLNCSMPLDGINLKIYDEDKLLEQKNYNKKSYFNYELKYYKLDMKITSENTTCTLNHNGIVEEYDYDGDMKIEQDFFNTFTVDCVDEVDKIEIEVSDKNNKEIYYDLYENVSRVNYNVDKSISKDYNTIVYFTDNFTKNNKCTLTLDGKTIVSKSFANSMKRKEFVISSKVGNLIKVSCVYPVKQIKVFVDNRRWDYEVIGRTYNNTKLINLNIKDNIKPKVIVPVNHVGFIDPPVEKPAVVEPVVKILVYDNDTNNYTEVKPKAISRDDYIKNNYKMVEKKEEPEKSWWSWLWSWI